MKKIGLLIASLFSLSTIYVHSVNIGDIHDIYDAVEFIKKSINFDSITIKSNVPYTLVQKTITKYCPQSSIDQANKELGRLVDVRSESLYKPGNNKSLSDRFDMIKGLIIKQKKDNQYKYCKDSYLLFSILETTHNLYYGKNDGKKANANNNSQKTSQNTNSNSHNSAKTENFNFTFIHNSDGLPDDVKKSFSSISETYLQDIMSDLLSINILDNNDLKILNNKIVVTYQQSCNITEGTFRVVKNKQTGQYTFKGIELIIAYCEKYNTPERQKRHVQQILAHELGHYIYFFKDKHPSDFSEICWDNGKINCLPEDFVTNYAKKSQEEDYAESFAYWYLYNSKGDSDKQHGSAPDNPINRRSRYFEELFEKEEDDDDEIQ